MARPTWKGSLAFGLVNVPVELFPATEDRAVRFHEIEASTGERTRHRRVAERSGDEVPSAKIVKAYEIRAGEYVRVEPADLEAVAPERSHTIEVSDFVDLAEIDPVYYRRSYHLVPSEAGRRAYWLLHQAMRTTGRVAIGRVVLRTKEHLVALRPVDTGLVAETMYFADEMRSADDLGVAERTKPSERELETARTLIDSLTTTWDPSAYEDTYRARLLALIEQKARGEDVVAASEERHPEPVGDLLAALEASVKRVGPHPAPGNTRDRAPDVPLDELTRAELYELAADADVEGRSKMTKAQLLKALRKRSLRRVS